MAKQTQNAFRNLKNKLKVDSASIRVENMSGRTYTVVPMVMLVHGVHNGQQGAYLYTAEVLSKQPVLWNM